MQILGYQGNKTVITMVKLEQTHTTLSSILGSEKLELYVVSRHTSQWISWCGTRLSQVNDAYSMETLVRIIETCSENSHAAHDVSWHITLKGGLQ
jgi:hypothetical protein